MTKAWECQVPPPASSLMIGNNGDLVVACREPGLIDYLCKSHLVLHLMQKIHKTDINYSKSQLFE